MPLTVRVHPIVLDRIDEWLRFVEELTGPRRLEWAESHRRRGITRQAVSLVGARERPLSVIFIEAADPEAADDLLRSSTNEFDVWLRRHLDELHEPALPAELLFDTAPRRGPWRGLRSRRERP